MKVMLNNILYVSTSNIELRAEMQITWNISENKNACNIKNVLWYCFDEETFYWTLIIVIKESDEISSYRCAQNFCSFPP